MLLVVEIWNRISLFEIFGNQKVYRKQRTHVRHQQPGTQATEISLTNSEFYSFFMSNTAYQFIIIV